MFKDSDDEENFKVTYTKDGICSFILNFLNWVKLICMIGIIAYFWVYTAQIRLWEVDVLE